ncbi:phosphogluconate dehydratase [Pokkaliibacter plantistimulans]|uniref:Phosphogluconate dehydratase n=1 Tax=Pokkaliibacter plantistimulans TaxID=1635171 RepID=A0ABX5LZG3_9GAMM|nr:phosphogluconate dehydratase [Pokkaliibacter plantistimulans]PXF30848.1 phosphogluconate dehydratase [Pokkaliibacter plantistimulans]
MHPILAEVTERIRQRSEASRSAYIKAMKQAEQKGPYRGTLGCGNLAHGFAACAQTDKQTLKLMNQANVAIVSSYNDMLSAHQPLQSFPEIIKQAAHEMGSVAQFAGGVPAMCDGVTQGEPGMELSLFSRDVIAMSTAIALSHNMFDSALYLGVCDKIIPGLVIGALRFGHLPGLFVPAGPMVSGMPNKEKARIRQLFAEGKVGRDELLEAESQSYHSPGTCTFYGTANSNQMLMEIMGLHLPGAAFVNPGTPMRDALTAEAARQAVRNSHVGGKFRPLYDIVDEKAIVNAMVALMATGGSTNHTLHLVAMAAAAGIRIDWQDFSDLSAVTPLLCRIYPNGQADVNHFHAAGGVGFLVRELLDAGLLHEDVKTVVGDSLRDYANEPFLDGSQVCWRAAPVNSLDETVLRPASRPFNDEGGLKLLQGNLGRGVIKVSAVADEHQIVEAPARVFHDQLELAAAFKNGELECDFIAVVRFQGPAACGMPELHKMTPYLGVLQDKGFKVALVTDGRMSGASGKVPAAIHVCPEAVHGGPLAKVRDGDMVRLNAKTGELQVLVGDAEWAGRELVKVGEVSHQGMGRELFAMMRQVVNGAEQGATVFGQLEAYRHE